MKDGHKSCNLSSVFGVIWSISRRWNIRCTVVCTDTNRNEAAADQVMYKGNTLGCNFQCTVRQQDIVVDQCRTMGNLNEDIFSYACDSVIPCLEVIRKSIVMEEISCNAGSLCLPVKPQTTGAVVDMVAAENNIDSSMHFDTANLCSCQILLVINVVDMVVFNNREYASKMSYNTCLTAVMDFTSAHNMGTDVFFIPSFIGSLADAVAFCLSSVFVFPL